MTTGSMYTSLRGVPTVSVVREWLALFRWRLSQSRKPNDFGALFSTIADYRDRLQRFSNVDLQRAKVLEIGFGQRPYVLCTLRSMGIDAIGIDLERPVLRGTPAEFARIGREHGLQRLLKSAVRYFVFDGRERRTLAAILRQRGIRYRDRTDTEAFLIGNVASEQISRRIQTASRDLIVSEDVFQHIAEDDLPVTVARMKNWLKPTGIGSVRLTLFTGITGGHYIEWYPPVDRPALRRTEPWEHLRRGRFAPNVYLNRLRLADWCALFSREFDIVEIKKYDARLGADLLTPAVREELSSYSDEELLTNEVCFVLKPKSRP